MEDALRDGLAGVAPDTEDLDATRALPDDEATRMLSPTASTGAVRPRRPLQPVDEPPRRTSAGRPAPARRQPPGRQKQRGGAGKWSALLLVLALVAGGVVAYQAIGDATAKTVELNEDVGGNVDEAVQSFKDLVEQNTR